MQKLTIVIPMAGEGSRFKKYGFKLNKYMLPLNTQLETMIEKAIISLDVNLTTFDPLFIFITKQVTNDIRSHLMDICTKMNYRYKIIDLEYLTQGPASTVIEAIDWIPLDDQLIVSNSDQVLDWNFDKFIQTAQQYDGCVLTYPLPYSKDIGSTDKHSFIKLDTRGRVIDVAEKIVLSDIALVGVHYYKKARYFVESYNDMLSNNIRASNGEFYLSLTYKSMINSGKYSVGIHHIDQQKDIFYPTGEPLDYFDYLHNKSPIPYIFNITDMPACEQVTENILFKTFHENDIYKNTNDYCLCVLTGRLMGQIICNIQTYQFVDTCHVVIIENISVDKEGVYDLKSFVRGWFIGDFEPSIAKEYAYEVGLNTYKKDELGDFHYHKESHEINILVSGHMRVNNMMIQSMQKYSIPKNQIACTIFLEDCSILCIKIPHVKNDKFCL
jgi:dTDP-glucose pyrophosphorylase